MAKKVVGQIKLEIPAGAANPAPPIGPALGQRGVNIMGFCKAFNAQTQGMEKNMPVPTLITVYQDKSFSFVTRTPPATFLLKKAAGEKKGSQTPGRGAIGKVTKAQCAEIARMKMEDLNAHDEEAAMSIIMGSARSMGLDVVE